MKKILILIGLLWSVGANAQFTPGQILTAAELNSQFALYSKLAGATFTGPVTIPSLTANAATQGFLDNSTLVATDAFVKQTVLAATAEIPIANFTGGTYNFATAGSGAQIVVLVSGGTIQSVLTVAVPGSGYQVGDCLVMVGGNGDAILRVTSLSGSGVAGASVVYGGTGYTTGAQLAAMGLPPGARTANLSGTLTSNGLIIIPAGTYLQGARRIGFNNNTVAGGFTITVKLSNGSGGSTGTGTILPVPQNGVNSASTLLYTDGQNDVWPETGSLPSGNLPLSALASQAANTVVANVSGSVASPTAASLASCSTASSAMSYTSGTGFGCNTAINASSLGGTAAASYALLASPIFTGTPSAPTASTGTSTTQLATTAFVSNTFSAPPSYGSTTPAAVHATTVGATGLISPSTTIGIAGTTAADNAQAGSDGEYATANTSGTSLTSGVTANATSVSLTPGDWDVEGVAVFAPSATVNVQAAGISTTSATLGALGTYVSFQFVSPTAAGSTMSTPVVRVNVSTTTTVYVAVQAAFGSGTCTTNGFIRARRVR